MRTRALVLTASALCLPVALPAAAQPPARMTVQTISDPGLAPECGATAHTADVAVSGRTVVATWTMGLDNGIGAAVSRDGGRSFSDSARPLTECTGGPLGFVVDPDLAVGADGTPWVSASGPLPYSDDPAYVETGEPTGSVVVQVGDAAPRSVFEGVASERGFLETDPRDPDRGHVLTESLTRARAKAGPVAGGQTALGGPEGSLLLATTGDRGTTWTVQALREPSPGTGLLSLGLVRSGRALVALSTEYDMTDPATAVGVVQTGLPPVPVAAQTSLDDGATWSAPVVLDVVSQGTLLDASAGAGVIAVSAPQLDGSLFVWTSTDGGLTWSRSTATTGVAEPATAVAVDRTGRIGVLFYAVQGDQLQPQLSTSTDGGRTFGVPLPLAEPFAATTRSDSHMPPVGPYQGAAADGRDLLVAFTAASGDRTEVRLARVR